MDGVGLPVWLHAIAFCRVCSGFLSASFWRYHRSSDGTKSKNFGQGTLLHHGVWLTLSSSSSWGMRHQAKLIVHCISCSRISSIGLFELVNQTFLLNVLNQCLVHNSSTSWYWNFQTDEDPSALHKILAELPKLPFLQDINKRLTLHHASESKCSASFEIVMCVFEANPKAASVCDPVTNLYPFMLAGMHGNISASMRLSLRIPLSSLAEIRLKAVRSWGARARSQGGKRKRSHWRRGICLM